MAASTIKIVHEPGNTKQYVITVGQSMQYPVAVEVYDSVGNVVNLTNYTITAYFYLIGTTTQVKPTAGQIAWTAQSSGQFTFKNSATLLNASGSAQQYNLRFKLVSGSASYEIGGDKLIWRIR
jgi:hypothetical protein